LGPENLIPLKAGALKGLPERGPKWGRTGLVSK
jgi:hypothetical protein